MGKLWKEMTAEEQRKHYEATERYRNKNTGLYRSSALDYYYRNTEKCAEKSRRWRESNKEYIKEKQRIDKRKRKDLAIEYLGGICVDCSNTFHPAVFEFHHRNPEEKEGRDPSKWLSMKWERIIVELDKCDLLCANCHRLRHHKETYAKTEI